jgi:hypothetical protein
MPRQNDGETGEQGHKDDTGAPGTVIEAASNTLLLFGRRSVPLSLIALGTSFAAADIGARVDDSQVWTTPEFLSLLGFAALLVIFGCLERLLQVRSRA